MSVESLHCGTYPVLPMRSTVLFPFQMMPLTAGRPASMAAIQAALDSEEKTLVVASQRHAEVEEPTFDDLFPVATLAVIKRMSRKGDQIQALVQGTTRVRLLSQESAEPFLRYRVEALSDPVDSGPEVEARYAEVEQLAQRAFSLLQGESEISVESLTSGLELPIHLVYLLGAIFSFGLEQEQQLLGSDSVSESLRLLHESLSHEVQVLELRRQIATEAATEMTRQQREYFLRQQLRAIQRELGEEDGGDAELQAYRERLAQADLPDQARQAVETELSRLERTTPAAPDYQIIRTYLDLVLDLPWKKLTEDRLDLKQAREVLDEDHYGLDDVKERIIEHLAVMKLNPRARSPILCLVGPPGVGKTSIGQSIARAMGREFERLSLGGLHDEAELRGHRRTYIGAMPGRIIQSIRQVKVRNPVLMLDEVDKLGRDFRGDPASALMEILDPQQNRTFHDNYLDLPFDLSHVFFMLTANTLANLPRPLLDRMEIIRLAGYSAEEKLQIALRYLVPRQVSEAGLTTEQLELPAETVTELIRGYTREAGVRELQRMLGRLCRKVATRFAEGNAQPVVVRPDDLLDWLGTERVPPERIRHELTPGTAAGLAWTEAGGDVLYVEAVMLPGGQDLRITGQLGEVMRESAEAARSYVLSQADHLGLDSQRIRKASIHIHVPAGAVPKDGPSAGITMATALASLYADLPMRSDWAMTGELTLSGLVLPVGGIKEKVLAAHRAGMHGVILPKDNQRDLRELPEQVRHEMEFVFADTMETVLATAIPHLMKSEVAAETRLPASQKG